MKVVNLTENCDMINQDDTIMYFIHNGINNGVTFLLLDFKVKFEIHNMLSLI